MTRAIRASALAATTVLATTGALLTCTSAAGAATATVTCKSPVFKRQFYANTTFSGTPKKTDCDSQIDQNWGTGAPAAGLPGNYFGVRWTVTRDFGSGGPFAIPVATRDGLRVYLDGTRKVDIWKNVSTTQTKTADITIPSGTHTLRFDFVNWTGSANVKADYLPRTSATADKVKPLVPTGTSLAYDSSYRANFRWTAAKEMDLAGYRVYRRLQGTSYGSKPLATTTSTSYTDTTLPRNGAVYYYEVRAFDKAGNESAGTADKSVTTVDESAPAAPKGVEGNWKPDYSEKVSLSWYGNSEADLAGYNVYRSTVGRPLALTAANRLNGDKPLTSSWYQDPLPQTGATYQYAVTAVDTHGNESAASGTAEFYTRDNRPREHRVPRDGGRGRARGHADLGQVGGHQRGLRRVHGPALRQAAHGERPQGRGGRQGHPGHVLHGGGPAGGRHVLLHGRGRGRCGERGHPFCRDAGRRRGEQHPAAPGDGPDRHRPGERRLAELGRQ
ncbi:fibronectin type III domain-containing protein [Streptomyces griseoluteus]